MKDLTHHLQDSLLASGTRRDHNRKHLAQLNLCNHRNNHNIPHILKLRGNKPTFLWDPRFKSRRLSSRSPNCRMDRLPDLAPMLLQNHRPRPRLQHFQRHSNITHFSDLQMGDLPRLQTRTSHAMRCRRIRHQLLPREYLAVFALKTIYSAMD